MHKEFFFKGTALKDRFRRAASACIDDFERKAPAEMDAVQLAINSEPHSNGSFDVELRAFSKNYEVISSIKTKNLFQGLKTLKHRALRQVRAEKDKLVSGRRRTSQNHNLTEIHPAETDFESLEEISEAPFAV